MDNEEQTGKTERGRERETETDRQTERKRERVWVGGLKRRWNITTRKLRHLKLETTAKT